MGKTGVRKEFILALVFFTHICVSSSDECQQERQRLQAQVKTLEERVARQQMLLNQLRSQQTQISVTDDIYVDPSGQVEYTDCSQVYNDGKRQSGLYVIKPLQSPNKMTVYCDMSDGGGWTVFQRRTDGKESFYRNWAEYKKGFGNMRSSAGEFWLGNNNLHYLTSQGDYTLRINMEDFDGNQRFAVYKHFKVADEKDAYQLGFGEYTGTAGDSLAGTYHPEVQWWASHQGMKFSTYDRDNDRYEHNCAREDKAGWWFNRCHSANLNGLYYQGPYTAVTDNGIIWYTWHGWWYSLKSVHMKVRPAYFEPNTV